MRAVHQVNKLKQIGIKAAFWSSILSGDELGHIESLLASGQIEILYVSTSAVVTSRFSQLLSYIQSPLRLCVIEEAGYASQRSRNYKPYVAKAKTIFQRHNAEAIVCLTHHRDEKVIDDVCRLYGIPVSSVSALWRIMKSNLQIDAKYVLRDHDKFGLLLRLLEAHQGRTLVIAAAENDCRTMAMKLRSEGFDAKAIVTGDIPRSVSEVPAIFSATNRILCVPMSICKHLQHQDIRHIIHVSLIFPFARCCTQYLRTV